MTPREVDIIERALYWAFYTNTISFIEWEDCLNAMTRLEGSTIMIEQEEFCSTCHFLKGSIMHSRHCLMDYKGQWGGWPATDPEAREQR